MQPDPQRSARDFGRVRAGLVDRRDDGEVLERVGPRAQPDGIAHGQVEALGGGALDGDSGGLMRGRGRLRQGEHQVEDGDHTQGFTAVARVSGRQWPSEGMLEAQVEENGVRLVPAEGECVGHPRDDLEAAGEI